MTEPARLRHCPQCKRTFGVSEAEPFCSKRCRDLDLANWLDGSYRVPVPITERDLGELEATLEQGSSRDE